MDCEQCIARVAPYLDTRSPRCVDSDGLGNLNAPSPATCALDPAAAIQPRPGTRSRERETTAPATADRHRERVITAKPTAGTNSTSPATEHIACSSVNGCRRESQNIDPF